MKIQAKRGDVLDLTIIRRIAQGLIDDDCYDAHDLILVDVIDALVAILSTEEIPVAARLAIRHIAGIVEEDDVAQLHG